MDNFSELVGGESWVAVDEATSADEKYKNFIDTYNKHYNDAFKLTSTRRKNQRKDPKPWIMPWLEDACERKNKAYHEKIANPSPENTSKYNKLKAFTDKHVNLGKKKFYSDYFEKHQTDSKLQWKIINSLLSRNIKHSKIGKIRDCEGNVATSPQAIADKFNDYFASIAGKLKSKIPQSVGDTGQFLSPGIENSIYIEPTTSAEVSQIIDDLKVKATADINVATIKTAKNSTPKFSQVIADIINTSLSDGVYPTDIKTAKVVPIHNPKMLSLSLEFK